MKEGGVEEPCWFVSLISQQDEAFHAGNPIAGLHKSADALGHA